MTFYRNGAAGRIHIDGKDEMHKLDRTTFEIDRRLEFFSKKELNMQIGYHPGRWPVAIIKELIDNSLDACETVGIAPKIDIKADESGFSVQDNGPGLSSDVIHASLDFLKRVSDKAYYVSPTRGQLGNALKLVWAAPFVQNGESRVDVYTQGKHHMIEVAVDRLAQAPAVKFVTEKCDLVKIGTFIKIAWPDSACSQIDVFSVFF